MIKALEQVGSSAFLYRFKDNNKTQIHEAPIPNVDTHLRSTLLDKPMDDLDRHTQPQWRKLLCHYAACSLPCHSAFHVYLMTPCWISHFTNRLSMRSIHTNSRRKSRRHYQTY